MEAERRVFVRNLIGNSVRHRRRIVGVDHRHREVAGGRAARAVGRGHADVHHPHLRIARGTGETAVDGVEGKPRGKRAAIGKRGGVAQRVGAVRIGEGLLRNPEIEKAVFVQSLVGNR